VLLGAVRPEPWDKMGGKWTFSQQNIWAGLRPGPLLGGAQSVDPGCSENTAASARATDGFSATFRMVIGPVIVRYFGVIVSHL